MTKAKDIALQAADDAFHDGVKTACTVLVSNLLLATTPEARATAISQYKGGLQTWKDAHEQACAAIAEVLPP